MKAAWLAMIITFAAVPCFAADTNVAAALLRVDAQKKAIKDAINLRRSGLITTQSFRTYADAIAKVCGSDSITNVANSSKGSVASALALLSGTKDALRAAINDMGVDVSTAEPLSAYATKIKAINCPSSPGYVDSGILTTNQNPEDDVDFQCANETVCDVLADATSCQANTMYVDIPACVGSARASDWKLLYSCDGGCGSISSYPLTVGNVYRFDMRGQTCARNWVYIPGHATGLYSFQVNCNSKADCPCVGMVTAKNPGDPGYDYTTNSHSQWITVGKCATDSCYNLITVPGTTYEMIMAAQPAASLRIYKLGD
ncbi:MAG: hypothetical protein LBT45_03060 [Rickettsiales bacterium]|nr:hypothetical protein [Rickettsiales bacterium]